MSKENVDLVRRLYAEAGGLAASELVADDLQLDLTAVYLDLPVLRGVEEVRGYLDKSPWGTSLQFEPERYFDVDDERVLVFMLGTSTGQSSGVPVQARGAQEFTIRGGLVVSCKVYLDRDEALQAAGLAE
jgi:ketosteroid isomerase-like protein